MLPRTGICNPVGVGVGVESRVSCEPMKRIALSPAERALLQDVRDSDEDHGGLAGEELAQDEYESMDRLCSLGLVEAQGEYGEAPDGEEDERDAGRSSIVYRVTAAGVRALEASE